MYLSALGITVAVAVLAGLDRTAAGQFMVCRPIVAAPLTGWLLGDVAIGLQVGAMLELLWLGRLPVGAAIPPDDSQVAVGCTFLAVVSQAQTGLPPQAVAAASLLIGMPFGKAGQLFDRLARLANARLLNKAELALDRGRFECLERYHLQGLWHFAAASLATLTIVVGGGLLCLPIFLSYLDGPLIQAAPWIYLLFPLIGIGSMLSGLKVPRASLLFGVSFVFGLFFLALR
ncbi:PTS sugar transporter subunit IIC [Syntrophotalea acetylenivorans]|uniref:PTS sugar transporter subunit IIC n=1 Tax=Syntrophotalea acetylenivorans TaxID=1842532 RepID=UPI0009FB3498|nr:PTS sugar transporter subunit IIC [Syntrophotalea acetylenivorans]